METPSRYRYRPAMLTNIDLYHCAETENTAILSREMKAEFACRGSSVRLLSMEEGPPERIPAGRTLGFVFPVAVYMTYASVIRFFAELPKVRGVDCFMVSSLAGGYGGGTRFFNRVLSPKGYRLIGVREIPTPTVLFDSAADAQRVAVQIRAACVEARSFVSGLYAPRAAPVFGLFSRRKDAGPVEVDPGRCIECRFCEAICPESAVSGAEPCGACGTCILFCPVDARKWGA